MRAKASCRCYRGVRCMAVGLIRTIAMRDGAGGKGPDLGKAKANSLRQAAEEGQPLAEGNRMDQQEKFVDESRGDEVLGEAGASMGDDGGAILLLQLPDLCGEISIENPWVRPTAGPCGGRRSVLSFFRTVFQRIRHCAGNA